MLLPVSVHNELSSQQVCGDSSDGSMGSFTPRSKVYPCLVADHASPNVTFHGTWLASWLKITEVQLMLAQAKKDIYSKDSTMYQGKRDKRQADLGLKPSPEILPKLVSLFSLLVFSLSTDSLPLRLWLDIGTTAHKFCKC